jgi:aspartyl-tRNA(Asn)/glutamyl-tRNA(Gln) amidotransferase subunit A
MIAQTRGSSFGPEARRRILLGTALTSDASSSYEHAASVRRRIVGELSAAFEQVDLLASATAPEVAFRLGERSGDAARMHRSDALTVPASLAGLPAVSVPCGTCAADGVELPVGLQLCAPPRADARVLSAARCFQSATRHHLARAPLTGVLP